MITSIHLKILLLSIIVFNTTQALATVAVVRYPSGTPVQVCQASDSNTNCGGTPGGTPGGASGSIQYNNSGSFGGLWQANASGLDFGDTDFTLAVTSAGADPVLVLQAVGVSGTAQVGIQPGNIGFVVDGGNSVNLNNNNLSIQADISAPSAIFDISGGQVFANNFVLNDDIGSLKIKNIAINMDVEPTQSFRMASQDAGSPTARFFGTTGDSGSGTIDIYADNTANGFNQLVAGGGTDFYLYTYPTSNLILQPQDFVSGFVGIGESTPLHMIDVRGDARIQGTLFDSSNSAGNSGDILFTTGSALAWNSLVSQGIPKVVGTPVDLTAQGAAITATTIYAVPTSGKYRICFVATITRASSTSSVLGGAGGFQFLYTDTDDSVVKTTATTMFLTSSVNTTATTISGTAIVNAKASTNIQYQVGYTSVGVTAMQYNYHAWVERVI